MGIGQQVWDFRDQRDKWSEVMAGIEQIDMATTDPEQLAQLFENLEKGESPTTQVTETKPAEQADATATNDQATNEQQVAKQAPAAAEREPDGVSTKDGKHVIPYSVLKSERDRATRAEQLANEMRERVAALEALQKQGNQGAKEGESARTDQQPNVSDLSPEDLDALKEDFPTVYKAVMASMAAAKALESKLQPVEASVRSQEAERAQSATETVQEAIDSIPKLAHLQATDAEAFDLAKQFDATLRSQPAWADKSLSERFVKVTEMVEAVLGAIDVPGSKPTSQASAEDLRKAAVAKAQAAAKATRTNVPNSLSEFPVGQPAAQDEREAVEQLTQLQLADKFGRMSPAEMDAYFSEL